MEVLENSWLVLTKEWSAVLGILCLLFLWGGILFWFLKTIFFNRLSSSEYLVLVIGGSISFFLPGTFLKQFLDFLSVEIDFLAFSLLIFILVSGFGVYRFRKHFNRRVSPGWASCVLLLLILAISIVVRLAFISGLIVPPYFDSAVHYTIVADLVKQLGTAAIPTYVPPGGGYYHTGFHFLVAALTLTLHTNIQDTILILGQILLALIPLPIFFLIRQETKLDSAGIFATLISGWGWAMPAFSINWGKYPALTSIICLEFVLCNLYLVAQSEKRQRWVVIGLLSLSILVSTLIHTRAIILILMALISIFFASAWLKLSQRIRNLVFCLAACGLSAVVYIIQSRPILQLVFDPYRSWVSLLVLLLVPFALKYFPLATFASLLSTFFLLGGLFIPVTQFGYGDQTILDRPLVEMVLFLPFAILGGLGYAGALQFVTTSLSATLHPKYLKSLISLLLFGVSATSFAQYNFFPSGCCRLFSSDDAAALGWMDGNIPVNASVFISSTEMVVFETTSATGYTGSDGGIWIAPLIHRTGFPLPYQTDFAAKETHNQLCQGGATYVYVGGTGQSFNAAKLQSRPDWYETLLSLPKAQIYKIVGCQ